jgi:cysteine dioxygenase
MDLNEMIANIEKHIVNKGDFKDIGYLLECYNCEDWLSYINPNTTGISKNTAYLSFNIEVIIISWSGDYETLPHNHASNGCWLKLLSGELIETLYNHQIEKVGSKNISSNQVSFMHNDFGYHSIKNKLNSNCYSLHIYSPPKHKTTYFQNLN